MVAEKLAPSAKYVSTKPAKSVAAFTEQLATDLNTLHNGGIVVSPLTKRALEISKRLTR